LQVLNKPSVTISKNDRTANEEQRSAGGVHASRRDNDRRHKWERRPLVGRGRTDAFEFPGCRATFYGHYTRLLKAAALPSGRKFKPQKIRRTFASFLELAGGDATEALGHSSRKVTKQSYLDQSIVKRSVPNKLLPLLNPPDEENPHKAA